MKRETFSNKFAFIAAAAGSAVGLGNIWKFPYEAGKNGGAAFILIYLFFVFLIGLPLIISEVGIGRKTRKNAVGAFVKLTKKKRWGNIGVLGVISGFAILSFYGVVAGWTIEYLWLAISNAFEGQTPADLSNEFNNFIQNPIKPVIYQLIFVFLTGFIVYFGVKNGIEKYSKILMPALVIIIIFLDIWSLTLDGAGSALKFLFSPDFSKITTSNVLYAMGQAFFSLSVGLGTMITYGSYIKKEDNLIKSATQISIIDTMIAILAGLAIFPAVFSFGIEPSQGPGLVFIALPNIFSQMTGGYFFGVIFFALLSIAALTSSISILELLVVVFTEELKIRRTVSTILLSSIIAVIGILCSLSQGILSEMKVIDKNIFDLLEFSSSNIFLPLGGLLIAIFVGWRYSKDKFKEEITNKGKVKFLFYPLFRFLIKFIVPVAILLVFLNGFGLL
jgi:NSS family neurotransmitter:Na+ symporter